MFVGVSLLFFPIHSKFHNRDGYSTLLVVDISYPQRFYTLLGLVLKMGKYQIIQVIFPFQNICCVFLM